MLQTYSYPDDFQVRPRVIYGRYMIAAIRTNDPDTELDEAMIGLLHEPIPTDQKVAYATMVVFRICCLEQDHKRCEQIRSIFQRLELNMLFITRVQILSDLLIKQHALQKANEWLLKGLEIDPNSEQLAKGLIKLYLQFERKNDAKVFYKAFRGAIDI